MEHAAECDPGIGHSGPAAALLRWPGLHPVPPLLGSAALFGLIARMEEPMRLEGLPGDLVERLVSDCPDAVIYADERGVIRFWNTAATRIFGYDDTEALGASLDLIIPERLRARHWQGYGEVMKGRPSRYGEGALLSVPAWRKDGRQISVEFTILPLHDASGGLFGIAAFLRDVTARFEETRALRREVAELKAQVGHG